MGKLIEKIKEIIKSILGESQNEKIYVKNGIVHDISNIKLDEDKVNDYSDMNIKGMQFGNNNVVRKMTEEEKRKHEMKIEEIKRNAQEQRKQKTPEQFRKECKQSTTTIKVGDHMTINFGEGTVVKNCELGNGKIIIIDNDEYQH